METMTVRQLIEKLGTMNPDLPIVVQCEKSYDTAHGLVGIHARRTDDMANHSQVVVARTTIGYISTEYLDADD